MTLDTLASLLVSETEDPEVFAECVRMARVVKHNGGRCIGLMPASAGVATLPFSLQLGAALVALAGAPTAVVEGREGHADLGPELGLPRLPRLPPEASPLRYEDDAGAFVAQWVRPSLALVFPRTRASIAEALPQLQDLLQKRMGLFENVLVDLSGFMKTGIELEAMALVTSVIVVARAGVTVEAELTEAFSLVPEPMNLGVVLTGERR